MAMQMQMQCECCEAAGPLPNCSQCLEGTTFSELMVEIPAADGWESCCAIIAAIFVLAWLIPELSECTWQIELDHPCADDLPGDPEIPGTDAKLIISGNLSVDPGFPYFRKLTITVAETWWGGIGVGLLSAGAEWELYFPSSVEERVDCQELVGEGLEVPFKNIYGTTIGEFTFYGPCTEAYGSMMSVPPVIVTAIP